MSSYLPELCVALLGNAIDRERLRLEGTPGRTMPSPQNTVHLLIPSHLEHIISM